jgi:predicted nucleic acid-binding protein
MIVVSDAGPLIQLGAIGQLGLLHALFERVSIPEAVWREVVVTGADRPRAGATRSATWIRVLHANEHAAASLRERLGAGEAVAIVLATEVHALNRS